MPLGVGGVVEVVVDVVVAASEGLVPTGDVVLAAPASELPARATPATAVPASTSVAVAAISSLRTVIGSCRRRGRRRGARRRRYVRR